MTRSIHCHVMTQSIMHQALGLSLTLSPPLPPLMHASDGPELPMLARYQDMDDDDEMDTGGLIMPCSKPCTSYCFHSMLEDHPKH